MAVTYEKDHWIAVMKADGTSGAGGGGGGGLTPVTKTTTYSAVNGDYVMADATAGAFTVTAPSGVSGNRFAVKKTDSSLNAVTIAVTVDGTTNPRLLLQHEFIELLHDATAWRVVN